MGGGMDFGSPGGGDMMPSLLQGNGSGGGTDSQQFSVPKSVSGAGVRWPDFVSYSFVAIPEISRDRS